MLLLLLLIFPVKSDFPFEVKILSVESAFQCVSQVSGQLGPYSVQLTNCSSGKVREQAWSFPLHNFSIGNNLYLPLVASPGFCFGVSGGSLGLYSCQDSAEVQWHWSNVSTKNYGIFYLRHISTGQCLMRATTGLASTLPLALPRLEMRECPFPNATEPTHAGHSANVTPFMWTPAAFAHLIPEAELPLRSIGADIIGTSGRVVRLRGINWYGAYMQQHVNAGLDYLSCDEIARLILNMGFNHVRMNYGIQQQAENAAVNESLLSANPDLKGLRSMEVFDANIETLTRWGLLVIVNNHVTTDAWCCVADDGNSMWYNQEWTEAQWFQSLTKISARYALNKRVIGIDLRNEVRPDLQKQDGWVIPWWGQFGGLDILTADWRLAAQEGCMAVWHGDPEALCFVEGNLGLDLSGVTTQPMAFGQECLFTRVVYSAHEYDWFSKWFEIVMALDTTNRVELMQQISEASAAFDHQSPETTQDFAEFKYQRDHVWGYLVRKDVGPVWIGEFGAETRTAWWNLFMLYVSELDLDWSYWPLNGYKYPRGYGTTSGDRNSLNAEEGDYYGMMQSNFQRIRTAWKLHELTPMLAQAGLRSTKRMHPGECIFNPALNSVRSSGSEGGTLTVQQLEVIMFLLLIGAGFAVIFGVVIVRRFVCNPKQESAYREMSKGALYETPDDDGESL